MIAEPQAIVVPLLAFEPWFDYFATTGFGQESLFLSGPHLVDTPISWPNTDQRRGPTTAKGLFAALMSAWFVLTLTIKKRSAQSATRARAAASATSRR
jgi:hypothetical protein